MKVSELFEALGPKKKETLEGIEIFDPNEDEYDETDKDGPSSYIGLRSVDKSARSKAILKMFKPHEGDVQWITTEKNSYTILFRGKIAPAIAKAKKMITKFAKAFDDEVVAKQKRADVRSAKGPSTPSASAEERKKMVAKYGADVVRRVTVKQVGGDDGYQWAVLVDGRVRVGGMTKREVPYEREQTYKYLSNKS